MTRTVLTLAILGCLVFIGAGVSKYLDSRTIDKLEVAADSLRLQIVATDVRLEAYSADSTRFEAEREQFRTLESSLRADLQAATGRTRLVIESLNSAQATIDVDTLSAGLRNLLAIQLEVAESYRSERDIMARRVRNLEAKSVVDSTELAQLGALIQAVRAERDSAMAIVAGHEARLEFNFFRSLFQDLPRKAACAAGGAIVAAVNNGKELTGALIGLGVCLAVEAIF